MMKKLGLLLSIWIGLSLTSDPCNAEEKFHFSHGPYIQELTPCGVTFVFTTSSDGVAWIELKAPDGTSTEHYQLKDGLRNAFTSFYSVRVERLKPNSEYQYRLKAKEMSGNRWYPIGYGDSIASEWHSFKTLDPKAEGGTFIALSDMHGDNAKLRKLLALCDYPEAETIFYVGDMMTHYDGKMIPFERFIDTSVELFASQKPFVMVRGNHETRGEYARSYFDFIPKNDGKIYGTYLHGDILFLLIDGGEDKVDTHAEYDGLTDFDSYRSEQAEWLKQVVQTPEFKNARYRIVMSHYPTIYPVEDGTTAPGRNYGPRDLNRKILPILNQANIDLMISGHTHRYSMNEPQEGLNNFPVLVNSNDMAAKLTVRDGKIHVKAVDSQGNEMLNRTFSK